MEEEADMEEEAASDGGGIELPLLDFPTSPSAPAFPASTAAQGCTHTVHAPLPGSSDAPAYATRSFSAAASAPARVLQLMASQV